VAEFGFKIMWGKIKKLKEVVCVLDIFQKMFFKAAENWLKILNFRWGFASNCPAVIPPLSSPVFPYFN
jgi:hypothetical protein